jgi:hypothetical protein
MRLLLLGFLAWMMAIPCAEAEATADTVGAARGVVWTPPDRARPARAVLRQMHAAGITAIRLTRLPPDAALPTADTLGLRLFVDLPAAYLSADGLRERRASLRTAIDRVAQRASQHASLHAVGLATNADTRTEATCEELRWLARAVERRAQQVRTYYVTALPPRLDVCTGVPDRVLVDLRGAVDPQARWQQWGEHEARAGVGAVGAWVDPSAPRGLRVPHSADRQARFLENLLPALLQTAPVVFVSRWRDAPLQEVRHYGLHDATGRPRPSFDAVRGMYTGTQTVFALPTGTAPPPTTPRLVLIGLGLMAGLLLLYARQPGARMAAYRYVRSHSFYRDILREGRDVLPRVSAALVLYALGTLAIIVFVAGRGLEEMPALTPLLELLPPTARDALAAWMAHPVGAGSGTAAAVLLAGGLWMLVLVGVAQRYGRFTFGQALMLVAWPCWPSVPGLLAALVLPPASAAGTTLGILLAGTGLAFTALLVRTLRDYVSVTEAPAGLSIPLALLSPWGLALAGSALVAGIADVPLALLWALLRHAG